MKDSILYEGLLDDLEKPKIMNISALTTDEIRKIYEDVLDALDGYLDDYTYVPLVNDLNQALVLLYYLRLEKHFRKLYKIPHSDNNTSSRTKNVNKAVKELWLELIKAKDLDTGLAVLDMFEGYKAPKRLDYIKPILKRFDTDLEEVGISKTKRAKLSTILKNFYINSTN